MGLIKQDKRMQVLNFLNESEHGKEPFSAYEITKAIYPNAKTGEIVSLRPFIKKILDLEVKRGIVEKINSKPCFYTINKKASYIIPKSKTLRKVRCPNCNREWLVEESQERKTCVCMKGGKDRFRFWINAAKTKQIITKSYLNNNSKYSPKTEEGNPELTPEKVQESLPDY